MEALPRHAIRDEYAVQEMILLYSSASAQKRIELMSDWYAQSGGWRLPFEVAKLAVEDPDDSVRYWMARNARDLDYRAWVWETHEDANGAKVHRLEPPARGSAADAHSVRNLEARLRADPVPVVRAAVFENLRLYDPSFIRPHLHDADALAAMSRLERLACMRNPWVGVHVAQKAADMALPMEERQELILALLTNPRFVERDQFGVQPRRERFDEYELEMEYAKLWDTIGRWPYSRAKIEFFRRIYAPASKKKEIYKATQEEDMRRAILEGCDEKDYDAWDVLELGTSDSDPDCRELAYSKLPVGMVYKKLREILKGSDKASILGLYSNPNVTATQLEAIRQRIGELDLWDDAQDFSTALMRQRRRERTAADMQLDLPRKLHGRSARYRAYAWDILCGLFVLGTSLGLLIACREDQRALLAVLIIACCIALWLAKSLPYRFAIVENYAARRLNELKKLLGAKDVAQSEELTFEAETQLRHSNARLTIRGMFLGAASLVALGGLILAMLP